MDIQFPQILFQIVNFGVVAGALTFLLYKPIKKMLNERSERIEEAQKAAEIAIAEKKQLVEDKKKLHHDAERAAEKILEEASQEAAAKRRELLSQAKKEAEAEIVSMKRQWEQEKKSVMEQMHSEFDLAVIEAVKKVTGVALSKKDHAQLISEELTALLDRI